jgi:hypothetical protein
MLRRGELQDMRVEKLLLVTMVGDLLLARALKSLYVHSITTRKRYESLARSQNWRICITPVPLNKLRAPPHDVLFLVPDFSHYCGGG